jgi:poly-beta-1,6-N-acetyl-D-glucosamine N-deacetylase
MQKPVNCLLVWISAIRQSSLNFLKIKQVGSMTKSFRNLIGYLVANALMATGCVKRATAKALETPCILSLYFHKPTKAEFEYCIRWFKKKGFTFLSPQIIEKVINKEVPFPSGGVLLTVDDGWQSNITNVVEVARRYNVPVTIFVATTPAEEGVYWWSYVHQAHQQGLTQVSKQSLKKMPEQKRVDILQELKKKIVPGRDAMTISEVSAVSGCTYVTIGSHTQTHPILVNCHKEQVYNELKFSRLKLEAWIGKEVPYFAYPNGDYSLREIQILKALGYRLAFCSDPKYLTPESLNDCFALPRFGFLEGASCAENVCRITGVWHTAMQKLPGRGWLLGNKIRQHVRFSKMLLRGWHLQDMDKS